MIDVAAAIIENHNGQLLIARRKSGKSQAGLWEFPGGKLEQGETIEACLRRELLEEMNINIEPYEAFGVHSHHYETAHIRLYAYKAKFVSGHIKLSDHDQYAWSTAEELDKYEFAPADLPFVNKLMSQLKQ
ncbi:8-oxo-dGTP diphosphatase MutT [Paenibacillus septentrionalis]|uniref:8-oxo-dGTP diphosphatase n=1 Tax=Paenibacillus septentrionalis TaxID=429342 RepID=A0ABW1V911_9BACL